MLIGKLAKISGMSKDGIRHYEQMGIISSSRRQAGSRWYSDYDESALEMIELARQGRQLGFSLKEIGPLLKAHTEREMTAQETIALLEERLEVVRQKINGLREVEQFICRKVSRYKDDLGTRN